MYLQVCTVLHCSRTFPSFEGRAEICTVMSSLCVSNCNRICEIHNGPILTEEMYFATNASADPWSSPRFLSLSLSRHDSSLQSLQSPLGSPSASSLYYLPSSSASSFPSSSCLPNFIFYAFVPACDFPSTSSQAAVLGKPAFVFHLLPGLIVGQLQGLFHPGDGEGFLHLSLLLVLWDIARKLLINLSIASACSLYHSYTHWRCFRFHWELSLSYSLSLLFHGNPTGVLAATVLIK